MTENSVNRDSKKQVATILAIPLIVVLLSTALFFLARENVISFGTVNNGTLIQPPVQMGELSPSRNDGSEFMFNLPESKWVFMVVGGAGCQQACERMLYLTRQTRVALGKQMDQVERVYLALDGPLSGEFRDFLEQKHADITVLHASADTFLQAFEHVEISPRDPQSFYVVDPMGWAMMYYRASDTGLDSLTGLGKDILHDMKRLLK